MAILPLALILAGMGCITGFLAGLLGVGGSVIMVPVLFSVLIEPSACIWRSVRRWPASC